jgi:hypothetical protein
VTFGQDVPTAIPYTFVRFRSVCEVWPERTYSRLLDIFVRFAALCEVWTKSPYSSATYICEVWPRS